MTQPYPDIQSACSGCQRPGKRLGYDVVPSLDHAIAPGDAHADYRARTWRPLARRRFNTNRPFLVFIRLRKPWVFARRRLLGWTVRFIVHLLGPCPGGMGEPSSLPAEVPGLKPKELSHNGSRVLEYHPRRQNTSPARLADGCASMVSGGSTGCSPWLRTIHTRSGLSLIHI